MQRNATYDYARLIAAFGIVIFHAHAPGAQIGYAALPFFLMLMIVMAIPAAGRQAFGPYAQSRATRLLRPWLIWSVIYGCLKLIEVWVTDSTLATEFAPWMLLTGPIIHLWFLPFAFAACLALYPVVRLAGQRGTQTVALALLVLGLSIQAARQGLFLGPPLGQWVFVAPAACLGLGMALVAERPILQFALPIVFVAVSATMGWDVGLLQMALASAALLFCGVIHLPPTPASDIAASSALGVYLAHPLVFSLMGRTLPMATDTLIFAVMAGLGAWVLALVWPRITSAGPRAAG